MSSKSIYHQPKISDIESIISEKNIIVNVKYLTKYLNFIEKFSNKGKIHSKTELHHILPKCMFPEYGNLKIFSFNKSHLSLRAHWLAHAMLCKVFPNEGKLKYAFWCMSHQKSDTQPERNLYTSSRLYAIYRQCAVEFISESRKGHKHTPEQNKKRSMARSTRIERENNIWRQFKRKDLFKEYNDLRCAIVNCADICWNIPSCIARHLGITIYPVTSIMKLEGIEIVIDSKAAKVLRTYGTKFKSYQEYVDSILKLKMERNISYIEISEILGIHCSGVKTLLESHKISTDFDKRKTGPKKNSLSAKRCGMKKNTHIWITNGKDVKRLPIYETIPNGWVYGRSNFLKATHLK